MCLAGLYIDRELFPGVVAFPPSFGTEEPIRFRFDCTYPGAGAKAAGSPSDASIECTVGMWHSQPSRWHVRTEEREYCRIIGGRIRLFDGIGRGWEFGTGSAFLWLRGFEGTLQVVDSAQIAYTIFALPERGALDWCVDHSYRTALGRTQIE